MAKKVLGIGNALVDIITKVNEDFLSNKKFKKGSMVLISWQEIRSIISGLKAINKSPGGSASNTICALSELGIATKFIGKLGKDDMGKFYYEDMIKRKVEPLLVYGDRPTGICCSFVTPDQERTMATYLGASTELKPEEIKKEFFQDIDIFYIEGFLLHNYHLIDNSLQLAKQYDAKICLDISSYNIVNEHKEYLWKIIKEYVDILFSNEDEAKALTGKNPTESLKDLNKSCQISIVKLGSQGSLVGDSKNIIKIEPFHVKAIDTTGAGDAYAAGFLFGIANGISITKSAKIGSLLGSFVVKEIGSKFPEHIWHTIRQQVQQIINE